MTLHDVTKWSKRNVWLTSDGHLMTRPGLRAIHTPGSGESFVGGFSIRNDYAGDVSHYLATKHATSGVRLYILDENFATFQIVQWASDGDPLVISHARVGDQMLIASPGLPTLFGTVGNGLTYATKVTSDNPATTAIDVPSGIVVAICNRACLFDGSNMYSTDPVSTDGGDLRTFVAANANQRPGVVYGAHEGADGSLIVVTTVGTFALDVDAFAVQVVGSNGTSWRKLSDVSAHSYESTCEHRGRVLALTETGYAPCDTDTDEEVELSDAIQPRAWGPRAHLDDFRRCRMFAMAEGPIVSSPALEMLHRSNLAHSFFSWWDYAGSVASADLGAVRGVLTQRDGTELVITETAVWMVWGDFDGGETIEERDIPRAVLAGVIPTAPDDNALPRFVNYSAAVDGNGTASGDREIGAAIRGADHTSDITEEDPFGFSDGDDYSEAGKRWMTTPLANLEVDFGDVEDTAATRDVGVEVYVKGGAARISETVEITMSSSAKKRPQAKG